MVKTSSLGCVPEGGNGSDARRHAKRWSLSVVPCEAPGRLPSIDGLNVCRLERRLLAAGVLVNFWFRDGSGTLQEIEVTSLISLLNVLHV